LSSTKIEFKKIGKFYVGGSTRVTTWRSRFGGSSALVDHRLGKKQEPSSQGLRKRGRRDSFLKKGGKGGGSEDVVYRLAKELAEYPISTNNNGHGK